MMTRDSREFGELSDGEIRLVIKSVDESDVESGIALRYGFSIILIRDDEDIGVVYFAADTSRRQYLRGHLSYGVNPLYAGHNYAAKACRLVKRVAIAHGFARLFIGSGSGNIASRKTIEKLGARPVEINDVPDEDILKTLADELIDMYVWDIEER